MKKCYLQYILPVCVCFLIGCVRVQDATIVDEVPQIFPDYKDVTIPKNIAPLIFTVEGSNYVVADFILDDDLLFSASGNGKNGIHISQKKWSLVRSKVSLNTEKVTLKVKVSAKFEGKGWVTYSPFSLYVVDDEIDRYVVYRLLKPGYEVLDRMGIYQRDVTSFKEYTVIENGSLPDKNDFGCVNCHSFCEYNADSMMYHGRIVAAGTVIMCGEDCKKVNLKIDGVGKGAYPKWHPHGRYIAYSMNDTHQVFHVFDRNRISGFDFSSDLMLYDVKNDEILLDDRFVGEEFYETFPTWSPDGKWLYFSRADFCGELPDNNVNMRYGIYRLPFDEEYGALGDLECVIDEHLTGKSQLFARISPDGRYLLYTECGYGTFPLSLKDSQLKLLDLNNDSDLNVDVLNSEDVESYHAWSSNGRWIMFSSRRVDGLYSHVYFAYFDKDGVAHKPFLMPQRSADFDKLRMKAYNVPEFTKNRISYSQREITKLQKGVTIPIKVRYSE